MIQVRAAFFLSIISLFAAANLQADAASAQAQFQKSQQLIMEGDLSGALQAADNGLKLSPNSVEGLNLVGIIYDHEKKFALAEAAFQHALKIDPRSTNTHNNLGNNYLLANKWEPAERAFLATLRLNPRDSDANFNLGSLLMARGRPGSAVGYLERVQPLDVDTSVMLVKAYLAADQTAKGIALARALSRKADNPQVHFSLGATLASNKQYAEAIREFELADRLQPNTFQVLYNLGQAYLLNTDYDQAAGTLRSAVRLHPSSIAALYLLAEAESDRHAYADALQTLGRIHSLDPTNPNFYFLTAQIGMSHGLYADAIALLDKGIRIAPRSAALHAALGQSYFKAGKTNLALAEFQKLIAFDPSATSYAFLGRAYQSMGQFEAAEKYLNRGLSKDPTNAVCLFTLGSMFYKQGKTKQAEHYLEEAVSAAPRFGDALYLLAEAKMDEGEYTGAVSLLRRCIQAEQGSPRAYYRLATAERHLGEQSSASEDFAKFKALSRNQRASKRQVQLLIESVEEDSRK